MVTCEFCGKQVKTPQGLRGHKTFVHGITGSSTPRSVAAPATALPVSLLEDRLQQLERATGLRESDSEFSLSDTEPLTHRLTSIADQVTKLTDAVSNLSDIVSKLSEGAELAKADTGTVNESNNRLKEAYYGLSHVVNSHRDMFNHSIAALGSRIDKVQKMAEESGEGLSIVKTKLAAHGHDGLSLIPQLSSRQQKMGEVIAWLREGVAKAQALAVRTPTDDFEKLELANGSTHAFRVYKGKRGLSRPHRISMDPFFGDKYVDLGEPEN
ncbi:MAG: hypothetical protein KJ624_08555 [Chloroflexi bacterium]|nr:hypothetical protein [Chloroflexota bacterium]